MIPTHLAAGACVAACLSTSAVALASNAPSASKERTWTGATAPLTIPGTGVKQGARLPHGASIVYRSVTLTHGQKANVALRAPAGTRLRGLANSGKVGFTVVSPRHYAGQRSVKVKAFAAPKATGRLTGRIYALVR